MPTLFSAAALASCAKLCVEGHLHTSFEMKNAVQKKVIRAIGNKGYIISKINEKIYWELVTVNAPYDGRGSLIFDDIQGVKSRVFSK